MQRNADAPSSPDLSVATGRAIDRRIADASDIINARIDGMQKAVEVFQADLTRVPTQLDRALIGLRELLEARLDGLSTLSDEKFLAVTHAADNMLRLWTERQRVLDERFESRDLRYEQTVVQDKVAVDVALLAAKEAMAKIEANFIKSMDGLQALLTTVSRASDEKIGDLKDRVTTMESRTAGITTANQEHRTVNTDTSTRMVSIIAILVAAAVGVGQVISAIASSSSIRAIENQQIELLKSTARNPVESRDLDILEKRLDALSRRLDDVTVKGKP